MRVYKLPVLPRTTLSVIATHGAFHAEGEFRFRLGNIDLRGYSLLHRHRLSSKGDHREG